MARFLGKNTNQNSSITPRRSERRQVIFPKPLKEVAEDMVKGAQPVTRLCYSDVDKIVVRGKNVATDLMGRMTFTEMVLFHLLNEQPSPMQITIIDAVLICIMEHGLSPSAIAARQTFLGAPESLQGAVASGILGVGSPLRWNLQ
jgi:citrate synthase